MTRRQQSLFAAPVLALMFFAAGLAPALAADPPSFAGTWAFNPDKGENLGMGAGVKESVTIAQTPEMLTLDFNASFMGKTSQRKVTYDLAGKSVPNEGPMGDKANTVAKWADGKLVTVWTSEGAVPGTQTVKTETRALSADGKTMSVTTVTGTKPPVVRVYEKQK